jgi:hypothetical protein
MRYLACCALGIALLCCTTVSTSAEPSSTTAGFQTITSPAGYQFQAPADWFQRTFLALPSGVDSAVQSADGKEFVTATVVPLPTSVQQSELSPAAPGLIARFTQGLAAGGNSVVNVSQGPDPIDIDGAAAAESFTTSITDNAGDSDVVAGRLALRGDSLYLFILRLPESFYSSDPGFATILDSFHLTAPTLGADLATPPPAFPLSSEEAILALLPYQLGPQDGLSSYLPSSTVTAYGVAVTALAAGAFPVEDFSMGLKAGLVAGFSQTLEPASQPNTPPSEAARLNVNLFDTADDAQAYATGQSIPPVSSAVFSYQPVSLAAGLGEAGAGWHVTATLPGQPSLAYFRIRWHRGQVLFFLTTQRLPLGEEHQTDAEHLAAAIDAAEQTRLPLSLGSPTVTPPVTEAQRLQAALQLRPFPLPAGATPAGFEAEPPYYADAATLVAFAPDPKTELGLTDSTWKMIISERQVFTSQQTSGVELLLTATRCTDSQGAAANASFLSSGPGSTSTQVAAPASLGDATYAYQDTAPDQMGNSMESQQVYWTHGAVVLSARLFGPPGTTSMDQVVALARQIDASYLAGLPAPSRPIVR